ncbi:LacI family DNA-binding transcriptional regulator [Streptomyces rishiriensis]|uniref:LacI family DNA-binding transcriptional regulator n=1 Tax=Streptomyces rishiriensis TaxID=68264 RepID=UPI00358E1901
MLRLPMTVNSLVHLEKRRRIKRTALGERSLMTGGRFQRPRLRRKESACPERGHAAPACGYAACMPRRAAGGRPDEKALPESPPEWRNGGGAGMKRPTLEVVAARAGVSKSSVSRVINGETTVAPEIRDVVMRAVQELGYVPNGAARNLVTRRTDTLAVVVSDPPQGVVSDDPLFSAVVRAVSRELEAAGKRLVLMLAESDQSRTRVEQYVAGGHVDGVMLVALHGTDPLPARPGQAGPAGRLLQPHLSPGRAVRGPGQRRRSGPCRESPSAAGPTPDRRHHRTTRPLRGA